MRCSSSNIVAQLAWEYIPNTIICVSASRYYPFRLFTHYALLPWCMVAGLLCRIAEFIVDCWTLTWSGVQVHRWTKGSLAKDACVASRPESLELIGGLPPIFYIPSWPASTLSWRPEAKPASLVNKWMQTGGGEEDISHQHLAILPARQWPLFLNLSRPHPHSSPQCWKDNRIVFC